MTREEKLLYHQIHPLKLATDFASSAASSIVLWRHELALAMAIGFLPSIAVTALLLRFADLEQRKDSAFGRYVRRNMSGAVVAQRATGQAVMWIGAWSRQGVVIALGLLVVALAWASGVGRPAEETRGDE
ncbi:hypothetical protein WMF37_05155 [Sorangium sp. So ce291]|uniref:hypothetical protein n=1 Tax=Sorangium sp. So ce291 TaxID=3133294 RepID=UPI003F63A9F1